MHLSPVARPPLCGEKSPRDAVRARMRAYARMGAQVQADTGMRTGIRPGRRAGEVQGYELVQRRVHAGGADNASYKQVARKLHASCTQVISKFPGAGGREGRIIFVRSRK